MSDYEDKVLHTYDGIQEYDNPLPGWWTGMFALCVVWGVVYFIGISLDLLPTYGVDLKREQQELAEVRYEYEKSRPRLKVTPALLAAAALDPVKQLEGQKVYRSNCASCHGDQGQGLIGPNLTDKFWLHGGDAVAIYNTIDKGVAANGMPPWGSSLLPRQIVDVTAYLESVRGKNVPGGKKAEGIEYVPKPADKTVD